MTTNTPTKEQVEAALIKLASIPMQISLADWQKVIGPITAYIASLEQRCAELEGEVANGEAKLAEASIDCHNLSAGADKLEAENTRLKAEVGRKDEALRFYAEGPYIDVYRNGVRHDAVVLADRGERAKAALAPAEPEVK